MSDADGTRDPPRSILSHEERHVAEGLAAGHSPAEIAADRDTDTETVERAADRVREKTDRALATLAASPFLEEAAAALDPAARRSLREALASATDQSVDEE
jgi:DNA-binding NarL/FixJ family response regulator